MGELPLAPKPFLAFSRELGPLSWIEVVRSWRCTRVGNPEWALEIAGKPRVNPHGYFIYEDNPIRLFRRAKIMVRCHPRLRSHRAAILMPSPRMRKRELWRKREARLRAMFWAPNWRSGLGRKFFRKKVRAKAA
jgi:hypothetical protein